MSVSQGGSAVAQRRPGMTGTRLVALGIIGMVLAGLVYLRFSGGEDRPSVPAGARAGDLILEPCSYATEAGDLPADCGTLVVPENRADPNSRLIALPVVRVRATGPNPAEPIFRLEGGPGISNMTFAAASRYAANHDVVVVGYRGVDSSTVLDCPEVESALKHSSDQLGDPTAEAFGVALTDCADRLRDEGFDLQGYSLGQRIDDLEAARTAFGYDRIDLISESAGTRTAMAYPWRYPEAIHRSVMIAVNPPGHFLYDAQLNDAQLERYAELCARDDTCSSRIDDLAASMRQTAEAMPDNWLFLPIKDGNARAGSFWGLMETSDATEPLIASAVIDAWLSAADGDASGLWFLSFLSDTAFPGAFVWGDVAAIGQQDLEAARDYYADGGDPGSILGNPGTEFTWAGGRLTESWPKNRPEDVYAEVQDSDVETLLIGGNLDFATPPAAATDELLPHLPNGHQVILSELGHTNDFWNTQIGASSHLINTFFDTGEVDDSRYRKVAADFSPRVRFTALGKGFVGTMAGLAILTIVSLLWMWRRVRTRGAIGPRWSAFHRSVSVVFFGFGGWFLGALILLATMPSVPIDIAALGVLGTGVPIGLGIYLAWVHRDEPSARRTAGFAAALGGALVGAWLGLLVTSELLALVTSILGAVAVANLALIVLDVTGEPSSSDEVRVIRDETMTEQVGV